MTIEDELLGGRPLTANDEWAGSKLRQAMARKQREDGERRMAGLSNLTGADRLRAEYREAADEVLARLRALFDDDMREADGVPRQYPVAKVGAERYDLRRRLAYLDTAHWSRLTAWLAESEMALAAARAKPIGDDQARIADLAEADQLARTSEPADLLGQARKLLQLDDARGASVRLQAAKLASGGRPVRGMVQVQADVDAALDRTVEYRSEAVDAHREARIAFAEAATERAKIAQLAALLAGDRPAAARASIRAKMQEFEGKREAGLPYEHVVKLERVGPAD